MVQLSLPLVPLGAGSSVGATRLMRMQNELKLSCDELYMNHELHLVRQEFEIYFERVHKQKNEVFARLNELREQADFMLLQGQMTHYEYARTMESIHQSRLDNLYNEYRLHLAAHRVAALSFSNQPR
jgi:hypothetical protein